MGWHWEKQDQWKLGIGYWFENKESPHGWEIYLGRKIFCFFSHYEDYNGKG